MLHLRPTDAERARGVVVENLQSENHTAGTAIHSRQKRRRRTIGGRTLAGNLFAPPINDANYSVLSYEEYNVLAENNGAANRSSGKINVTGESLTLAGLLHFTEYQITVRAGRCIYGHQCLSAHI